MDTIVSTSSSSRATQRRLPRLVIVEEHTAVADVLDAGLWGRYRVRSVIATEQRSVAATVAAARAARPDVAIVAVRPGPFIDSELVLRGLRAAGVPVIALSTVGVEDDPVLWGRCLLAGALGLLPKTADLADLTADAGPGPVGPADDVPGSGRRGSGRPRPAPPPTTSAGLRATDSAASAAGSAPSSPS